ncbi:MAG: iron-containing alcohol dehydrogenase [Clostridia bacterium]|nr:iron-containing alcohol dehydrogenase [Clostridia bacterium]
MYNFTFQIPTRINFGKGQISHLSELKESGNKVLMVYGGGSIKRSGIYDEAMKILKEAGLEVFELSGVEPNPRIESVRKGVEICKENCIDMVLAIGGGSVIDCAKVVAGGARYEGDPWDLVIAPAKIKAALPVYSVLTLAATGSEMDTFAVISDMSKNEKWGTGSPLFTPKMSVLDPTYTFTVSQKQTAAGTADMMSHTFENYFTSVEGFLQARFCEAVLKTCIKYGPIAYNDPENYEARANLMWASSWAINGTLNAGSGVAWCVHPMEHELSAFYDITHGQGLAILTPHWMRYVLSENTVDKFVEYGVNVWGIDDKLDKFEIANKAIDMTADFFKNELHIPMTLREVGITEKTNFEIMAEKAANGCKGCYVPLSKEDIIKIFEAAF